jgi:hypothetical protein
MERPTCDGCPYWFQGTAAGIDAHSEYESGQCRRHAPVSARWERHGGPLFVEPDEHSIVWPVTESHDFCGEHPNFTRYIAATRDDCAREHQP